MPWVSTGPDHFVTCRDLRPVGGCLTHNINVWRMVTHDPWILNVVANGYSPVFEGPRPPLTREWESHESITRSTPPDRALLLREHVQELLAKDAIEPVWDQKSLGFYSHMFLVPKKNGKLRPIINLRELNRHLVIPSFKMETSVSIAAAVQPGDWATSLDLTDAYFHVPIAFWFRKYLRIVVEGSVYQYKALPFGLSTSPLVFTKMLEPVAVFLHSRGIIFHRYLDDFLIRCQSQSLCLEWTHVTLHLLYWLGWGVSLEKSDFVPSQTFQYIGILFLTLLGIMRPPDDRIDKILEMAQRILSGPQTARTWLSFLGLLGSAEKQVPYGRLHIRPIHFCLHSQYRALSHSLDHPVVVDQEAVQAINWWTNLDNLKAGQPLGRFHPDITLYTDASKTTGWGAHAPGFQASGQWSLEEASLSINALELLAVHRALSMEDSLWKGKKVLVATDNSTAVAYINHQGGTRSMTLMNITYRLYDRVKELGVTLRARHIPGRLNRFADLLSRSDQVVNTEWTLCPRVAKMIWSVWGTPHLDLMATPLNSQLPVFVCPYPEDRAHHVDAMSFAWDGLDAYVFPPWPMIEQVLIKMQSHSCLLTMVVPRWPNRPWFPLLLQALVDFPRRLPLRDDLLRMPHNNLVHQQIRSLDLHVCRLSSSKPLHRAFLETCRRESLQGVAQTPPTGSTIRSGNVSLFGALNGISIPSRLL